MTVLTRRNLAAAVGAGAVAMGAGAWWRHRESPALPANANASGPLPTPMTTIDGRVLRAEALQGRPIVLNFWAPWCPPCVREMPELDRFSRSAEARGTLVIGLAIDDAPAVNTFIAAHPVEFPIVVLGYAGLKWVRQLSNDTNVALPFSAVFDRSWNLMQRKFGPTSAAELAGWVQSF